VYENYIGNVPYIANEEFIDFLNKIISKYDIDIILPTHDDVVVKLAQNKNNINAIVATPDLDQALITRSKKKTYELFKGYTFCPRVYSSIPSNHFFPIFSKPDEGQGGKGTAVINSDHDFILNDTFLKNNVICEFLPGDEFTIDCFTDSKGKLKFVGPRKRERIFGGISVRSTTVKLTQELNNIAKVINNKMKMNGLWYFQVKKDSNEIFKLLEVSIRTAGTMNLYRCLGVNFPLLTIYNLLGYEVNIICNEYELMVDRALQNRYKAKLEFKIIYIDFDDTITKVGKVNPEVMMFLYNAKLHKKKIILITKHEKNINKTLEDLAVHNGLFHKIIHLRANENKYEHIKTKKNTIFIDNSFHERYEVKNNLGIPVFDVDAIGSLINWKS
jgi:hypothetical protein